MTDVKWERHQSFVLYSRAERRATSTTAGRGHNGTDAELISSYWLRLLRKLTHSRSRRRRVAYISAFIGTLVCTVLTVDVRRCVAALIVVGKLAFVRSGKKMEWTTFAVILSVAVAVGQSHCNADLRSLTCRRVKLIVTIPEFSRENMFR